MIELREASKSFDEGFRPVITRFSYTFEEGMVYGINGDVNVGKTTLLRLIGGVYEPDAGTVTVDGLAAFANPKCGKLMAMADEMPFIPERMTIPQIEKMYRDCYGSFNQKVFLKTCEMCEIKENNTIRWMNREQKRKLVISLAVSTPAKYLLLDEFLETMFGLDSAVLEEIIKMATDMSKTVILTSSNLHDDTTLKNICHRILYMDEFGLQKVTYGIGKEI